MTQNMMIAALYRHPVKSLLGESCKSLMIDQRGVVGDRLYALVDDEGHLGSHKNSRRFRRMNGLFDLQAAVKDGDTNIIFPDGEMMTANDAELDARLSAFVGQSVTLQREADVSHFDDAPIHFITTAGLAWLRALLPNAGVDPRRFRPNIVIDCAGSGPIEHDWVGKHLRLGACEIEVVYPTERCVMTTLAQGGLPKAPEILKAVAQNAGVNFGVYAKIHKAGSLVVGEAVSFL